MDDLTGKTAFITGGAQGIGLGIAKACINAGMNVAIADILAGRNPAYDLSCIAGPVKMALKP